MKKIISALLILVLAVSGCSSDTAASGGDDVLTIWGFYEGDPKGGLELYEEQTGNQVEYVNIGFDDFETKLNTVIGTEDAPDLVLLDRTWLGKYIPSDNFLTFNEVMGESEKLDEYLNNAQEVALNPGLVDENLKAFSIGGSPSSVYFYRSDLAEQCLGVTSPEEMEELTPTFESYADLQETMNSSDDEACHDISITGYPSYETGLVSNIGMFNLEEDGSYVIPSEFDEVLDTIKEINEGNLVYSPQNDKTQVVAGNESNKILGEISPNYLNSSIRQYDQSGQWAVAQTPLNYTAGGTYIGITSNADTDMVAEYLEMTFFDDDWSVEHMETIGMSPNPNVVDKYLEETDATDEYYGNQEVIKEFSDAAGKVEYYSDVTPYDVGIKQSIENIVKEYSLNGTISTTDEAKEQLKEDINALYPQLDVTIE